MGRLTFREEVLVCLDLVVAYLIDVFAFLIFIMHCYEVFAGLVVIACIFANQVIAIALSSRVGQATHFILADLVAAGDPFRRKVFTGQPAFLVDSFLHSIVIIQSAWRVPLIVCRHE